MFGSVHVTLAAGSLGGRVMARLEELAALTDEPGALTRLYLSPAHRRAADSLIGWFRELGVAASIDAIGNVVARYEAATSGAPALIIGSHIDTVRNAGKYDGNLGVAAGLVAVEELARRGERLPFAIEIVAFGDEEGVRFPVTLSGSRALAGAFDPTSLDQRDEDGVTLREALIAFGCDPDGIAAIARRPADVLGFLEVHIEQGPVLETERLPVGIVTAINGATRLAVEMRGVAGHAGTVPMALRRDALACAAEGLVAVEELARGDEGLVATVGRIEARPGAVNVIPGEVRFTIDLRSPDDARRRAAVARIRERLAAIAAARDVALDIATTHEAGACACDPAIIAQVEQAVVRHGLRPLRLASGAGHDTMAVAALCPVGMLFVRCAGGVSHSPAEKITAADADVAMRVLLDTIRHFRPVRAD
ncbi:allantoate amidohydrolase [Bradyrhizobium jicamae]|uniref:allantoate amidohydrolase n=1 Tax=Bradyrhizobium jicamae TaxID=280332 RepID=UPI001BAC07A5|nr:allantoate amidohydrolase [Bradyrhizobium jicamae]MBR0932714.1 allantoate amidohydrolase [Bradyrhizobium jicamae]